MFNPSNEEKGAVSNTSVFLFILPAGGGAANTTDISRFGCCGRENI